MALIYPERESKTLEFKETLPKKLFSLLKTCVAFANGTGGKIIFGVKDQTREIVGISEACRNKLYDEFPNSLYDATSPSLLAEIYERNFAGTHLLIIEIPQSYKKPVFIKAEGSQEGVYIRVGSNTRKADKNQIEELMRETTRMTYDEEMVKADISILSSELLKTIYPRMQHERLLAEKVLMQLNSNTKSLYPTVTGVLCFCDQPDIYLPEALIRCSRFSGTSGRNIIQTEEMQGTILDQIEKAFNLIKSWLVRDYKLIGVKFVGQSMFPEIALREAIINAVLHRKYSIAGAIKIALYDDRLEIFSPGNFPGPIDLNSLGDGTTYLRNPHLTRLARRLGLIESLGTGIRLILETTKKAGLKRPEFIENADSVKVVFYFAAEKNPDVAEETALLQLFEKQQQLQIVDIMKFLKISRNTATRKLNHLIKTGKIIRLGKGPAVRFILKN